MLHRVTAIEQSIANVNNRMDSMEADIKTLLARLPAPAAPAAPNSAPASNDSLRALLEKCCHDQKESQEATDKQLDDILAQQTQLQKAVQDLTTRVATMTLVVPSDAAKQMGERVNEMGTGLDKNVREMDSKLAALIQHEIQERFGPVQQEMASMREEMKNSGEKLGAIETLIRQLADNESPARRPDGPPAVTGEGSASSVGSGGSPARRRAVRRRDSDGGARRGARGPEPVWNPANGRINHRPDDNALLDQGSASVPGRPGVQRGGMASTFAWPDSPPWSP